MQTIKLVKTGRVQEPGVKYCSPDAVYSLLRHMSKLDREHFVVLHLNGKNNVIAKETVSIGTLQQSLVHPREVFKAAIHNGSAAIIVAHNHPSGDPAPSAEDRGMTARLMSAGELLGIKVLDHIIVGENRYYSFCESSEIFTQRTGVPVAKKSGDVKRMSRKKSQEKTKPKQMLVTK